MIENDRGVIFVTVLIIIIVSMVLAVSILSLNISQVKSSETELKYIQAKTLAEGGLAQILTSQWSGTPANSIIFSETLGNTTFGISSDIDYSGSGPVGSNAVPLSIDVTF
jgi:type II secretory pathway component PulK